MPPPAGISRPSRSGMTLIEILLATAIAALVVALVFSVYHTVSATLRGQQERRQGPDAAAAAVGRAAHDLECAFAGANDPACAFTLVPADESDTGGSEISLCSAVAEEGERDTRWFALERVAYRLQGAPSGPRELVRESAALAGPGAYAPPVTNVLAGRVEQFLVRVYDGEEWKEAWPPESGTRFPRAARIELVCGQGTGTRAFQTSVVIPAGNPITSRVERVAGRGVGEVTSNQ